MIGVTHEVPRRITRWDAYHDALEKGELRAQGLTQVTIGAETILQLTAPDISIDNWAGILGEAAAADLVWQTDVEDPWAGGSQGWQEFLGLVDEMAPEVALEPTLDTAFAATSKEDFLAILGTVHPEPKGAMKSRVAVLRAIASFAWPDGGNAYPAQSTIAKQAGVSTATVKRVLGWASGSGWLQETERVHDGQVKWQLCAPVDIPDSVPELAAA